MVGPRRAIALRGTTQWAIHGWPCAWRARSGVLHWWRFRRAHIVGPVRVGRMSATPSGDAILVQTVVNRENADTAHFGRFGCRAVRRFERRQDHVPLDLGHRR